MHASRIRFSTAHLFYAILLSGVSVSLFGAMGLAVAALVLLIWSQILAGARREADQPSDLQDPSNLRAGFTRIELLAGLMLTAAITGLILPAKSDFDPMQQASNSMRQISKAISAYEAKHKCCIPAVVFDANGFPAHSWRSLILAELGEDKLAANYSFDEPWNGPNNILLLNYRPWHYRPFYPETEDPTISEAHRELTNIHLIQSSAPLKNESQHPIVFEHELARVHWLEPSSMTLADLQKLNRVPSEDAGFWDHGVLVSEHRGRLAASGDSVHVFHPGCHLNDLTKLSETQHTLGQPARLYHFGTLLRALLFAAVTLYPLRWLRKIHQG